MWVVTYYILENLDLWKSREERPQSEYVITIFHQ